MAEHGNEQPEAVAPAAEPAHGSGRRTYLAVFVLLFVFTVLEVAVASPSLGIGRRALVLALVGLALAKAALVAFFFMHLRHERRALRLTVLVPFVFPALYAVALVAEAGWRLVR
jgi:cytochrome c oxidase subunit 4